MSQPAKSSEPKLPEPSIDEILASIRRSIVPEDDAGKPASRKAASRKAAAVTAGNKGRRADGDSASADADAVPLPGNGGPGPIGQAVDRVVNGGDDDRVVRLNGEGRAAIIEPGPGHEGSAPDDCEAAEPGEATAAPDTPLLSPRATAAVDVAFNSLSHSMLSQNPRTLEDVVRDMLRPMLKEWLDANLPSMVERLVRAEIERVSRRG